MARHAHEVTGEKNLCLAGGVALNCVGNGQILAAGPFERIWIQPAAGDAGGALGAALFIWHQLLGNERIVQPNDSQRGSLLGPAYSDNDVRAFLDDCGANYHSFEDDELCEFVADLLAREQVVGWFQGRMEFGPRALGARSILGDARSPKMQSVMNLKIKFRESFRPFAPVVLREHASDFFELRETDESPYMLLVAPVRKGERLSLNGQEKNLRGLDRLKLPRSTIPAVTHVDYSARIQTVDEARNGKFHQLLCKFQDRTGCPVLINTSFNVRGEPIVCTPAEAYRCFLATNIDALVLENHVLLKEEQRSSQKIEREKYLAQFQLD
jgi:carbamoyltransferase